MYEPTTIKSRVAAIKMTILPKIIYLFSMITNNSIDSITTKLYWKNKKPKIKLITLPKHKTQGGLEAPNFNNYFLASQLQLMMTFIHPTAQGISWIEIEQSQCNEITISD